MKRIILALIMAIVAFQVANAQTNAQVYKQRAAEEKLAKEAADGSVMKAAKKDAKKLKREGWKVNPGDRSIEHQLNNVYIMREMLDEEGNDKYILGSANGVGTTKQLAITTSEANARLAIAAALQTEVTQMIEMGAAQEVYSQSEAEGISKFVSASKQLISEALKGTKSELCIFKLNSGVYECQTTLSYSRKAAIASVKAIIREKLEGEIDSLQEKLDAALK